ncbi:cytochrome P450 [Mycobacterium arosiense]|uniref:cytochrome P450 n=1 Tax=Mycobacterium arosiense TaxID=425468 RepID=UPI001301B40F|nr:cytochrome P450 [Mycobacterium arosiense]
MGIGDMGMPPLTTNPPEHGPIKGVLTTAFTVPKVAQLEPMVSAIIDAALDAVADKSSFDASHEFARVVPMFTIARLLGLPAEDDAKFTDWVYRMVELAGEDESFVAGMELLEYFNDKLTERQKRPGTDLITYLTQAEADGRMLDDAEIILASMALLLAGIDTTWSTLSAAILHLAKHPDHQQALRDHPEQILTACEEFLRYYAPVTVARQATTDQQLAGCPVQAGQMVLMPFGSANRDETRFENADQLVLDRTPNRHLAFGVGIHRCLGANLARLELRLALNAFLQRVPSFSLDVSKPVRWSQGQIRGPRTVPIIVDASAAY